MKIEHNILVKKTNKLKNQTKSNSTLPNNEIILCWNDFYGISIAVEILK